jgi:Na+/glutamate symporter
VFARSAKHLGAYLAAIVTVCGVVAAAAVAQFQINELTTRQQTDAHTHREEMAKLTSRQQDDRDLLIEVRADVKWIRAAIGSK